MLDYPEIPPSKVNVPVIDAHIHLDDASYFPQILNQAKSFRISRFIGITRWYSSAINYQLHDHQFPDTFKYAYYVPGDIINSPGQYQEKLLRSIENFVPRDKLAAINLLKLNSLLH